MTQFCNKTFRFIFMLTLNTKVSRAVRVTMHNGKLSMRLHKRLCCANLSLPLPSSTQQLSSASCQDDVLTIPHPPPLSVPGGDIVEKTRVGILNRRCDKGKVTTLRQN